MFLKRNKDKKEEEKDDEVVKKPRKAEKKEEDELAASVSHPLPAVFLSYSKAATGKLYFSETLRELTDILKSPAFIVIMIAGLLNFLSGLFSNDGAYGLTSHPVTWSLIDFIQGSFYTFLIAIITIYSGQLVWKERDNNMDEIYDATPHPTWVTYLSKFSAVAILILITQLMLIGFCVSSQLAKGFTDIRPWVYIKYLIVIDMSGLLLLVVLSMLLHTLINNKYIAFFARVGFQCFWCCGKIIQAAFCSCFFPFVRIAVAFKAYFFRFFDVFSQN